MKTSMFDSGEVLVKDSKCCNVFCFGKLHDWRNVPKPMDAGILWSSMAKNITRPKEAFPLFFPFSDERRLLTKFNKKCAKITKFHLQKREHPRATPSAIECTPRPRVVT